MVTVIVVTPEELRALIREEVAAAILNHAQPAPILTPAARPEMSLREVSELFGRSPKTIWVWRRRKVNPFPAPRSTGGNITFLRAEVEAWRQSLPRAP